MALLAAEGMAMGEEKITASPDGAFRIVQKRRPDGVVDNHLSGSGMEAHLSLEEDGFPYPAWFHISPDGRWIIRIQQWAAGESIACLYGLNAEHHWVRYEPRLDLWAWDAWHRAIGDEYHELYHHHIELVKWDLPRHRFQLSLRANDDQGLAYAVQDFRVWCNLRDYLCYRR